MFVGAEFISPATIKRPNDCLLRRQCARHVNRFIDLCLRRKVGADIARSR
jgi:hypothetical protein